MHKLQENTKEIQRQNKIPKTTRFPKIYIYIYKKYKNTQTTKNHKNIQQKNTTIHRN